MADVEELQHENQSLEKQARHKGKHDKPKPWDDDPNIDRWTVEKFDPEWNPTGMLEVSSFSTLFPQYREKYLQDSWPQIESALKQYGVACKLNLVEGSMTVSTTRKTRDPYIIVKARDLIKLLSRSVPAPQAIKILEDEVQCDIIKIGNLVRNKERFVKRRQRLVGPNSSTLKAMEILTDCYILVQGSTVAAMGSFKGLKQVRRVVEQCMRNEIHPVYQIKNLMMRRELAKDPALASESWDRFLPKFKKTNVQQKKPKNKEKKEYTPFPPPQPPSKVDMQLESGEYFMSNEKKSEKKWQEKQEKQTEKSTEKKRKRDDSFVPPEEPVQSSNKSEEGKKDLTELTKSIKCKTKELKKQRKTQEKVNAEEYIAVAPNDKSSKKKSKGFDIEGISGTGLIPFNCEGLSTFTHPYRPLVNRYAKLGLHRYNMKQGTNFELHALIKFNMVSRGACSFLITLAAGDTVTRGPMQIFQVRVAENRFGLLDATCTIARIKGETTNGFCLPQSVYGIPDCPHMMRLRARGEEEVNLASSYSDRLGSPRRRYFKHNSERFCSVDISKLRSNSWIRLYLELTVYTNDRMISDEDLSKLEIMKVAIETTNDEPPLKAKSSVLYIAFKGLARNGSGEQLERRAIIKSVFDEQTGSLSLMGDLCHRQDDVTFMSVEEMHYRFRQSLGAV
ncbi:hypothetical protein Bca52824_037261 [Brassica carinata]|uniref:KRR-R motif-containing protein 1 n=1 Tax=Brassica carinata TaxID=52824 RepID=A0A8X7SB64_BRACI|nr:hypothetical protein Bca52824_037261 [Brassica carinata]